MESLLVPAGDAEGVVDGDDPPKNGAPENGAGAGIEERQGLSIVR